MREGVLTESAMKELERAIAWAKVVGINIDPRDVVDHRTSAGGAHIGPDVQ